MNSDVHITESLAARPTLQRLGSINNNSCYFRTTVKPPHRKALVQITERCNLHCAHCFVSAGDYGDAIALTQVRDRVVPQLLAAKVVRVTLTGGEPTIHPDFLEVVDAFTDSGLPTTICTNGLRSDGETIERLRRSGRVRVNVSLDGFRKSSHGKFRGDLESFEKTVQGIRTYAAAGLLKGLLVTPNHLADDEEYVELHEFAAECGAEYVLMNPLSPFGRGARSISLISPVDSMNRIRAATDRFAAELDLVRIRFPNVSEPLQGCEAGNIIYVFTHGEVAVCPYLIFAAKNRISKHKPEEFVAANIFTDDIATALDSYPYVRRLAMGRNSTCASCRIAGACGKGCPAAVIGQGLRIGELDAEVCPEVSR
jgi:radical SAM protein with 4Fe4S-binding SPASM domain